MENNGDLSPRTVIRNWLLEHSHIGEPDGRTESSRHRSKRQRRASKERVTSSGAPRKVTHDSGPQPSESELHRSKRRRTQRDEESLLEAAASEDSRDTPQEASVDDRRRHHDLEAYSHSRSSQSQDRTAPSFRRSKQRALIETFERRPRRKTHEDHYTTRVGHQRLGKSGRARPEKPQSRGRLARRKSGANVMRDFQAANITQDRLTLRPPQGIGFFNKGKCSSPIKRQALPDLALSELNFLNQNQAEPRPYEKYFDESSRPKDKRKQAQTEEISHYFKSKLRTSSKQAHSLRPPYQETQFLPEEVDLPRQPFLGFGSRGPNSSSPMRHMRAQPRSHGQSQTQMPPLNAPVQSSNYLTWSQSERSPARPQKPADQEVPVHSSADVRKLSPPNPAALIPEPQRTMPSRAKQATMTGAQPRSADAKAKIRQIRYVDRKAEPVNDFEPGLANKDENPENSATQQIPGHTAPAQPKQANSSPKRMAYAEGQSDAMQPPHHASSKVPQQGPDLEYQKADRGYQQNHFDDAIDVLMEADRQPFAQEAHNERPTTEAIKQVKSHSPVQTRSYPPINQTPIMPQRERDAFVRPLRSYPSTTTPRPSTGQQPSSAVPKLIQRIPRGSVSRAHKMLPPQTVRRDSSPLETPRPQSWLPNSYLGRHVYPSTPMSRSSNLAGSFHERPHSMGSAALTHGQRPLYQSQMTNGTTYPYTSAHIHGPSTYNARSYRQQYHDDNLSFQGSSLGNADIKENDPFMTPRSHVVGREYQTVDENMARSYMEDGASNYCHPYLGANYVAPVLKSTPRRERTEYLDRPLQTLDRNATHFPADLYRMKQRPRRTQAARVDQENEDNVSKFWAPNGLK